MDFFVSVYGLNECVLIFESMNHINIVKNPGNFEIETFTFFSPRPPRHDPYINDPLQFYFDFCTFHASLFH